MAEQRTIISWLLNTPRDEVRHAPKVKPEITESQRKLYAWTGLAFGVLVLIFLNWPGVIYSKSILQDLLATYYSLQRYELPTFVLLTSIATLPVFWIARVKVGAAIHKFA